MAARGLPKEERVRESDFIILHKLAVYIVVEVKEGDVKYFNGQWHEFLSGGYVQFYKDPVEQVRTAMYKVRGLFRSTTGRDFTGRYRFAICFPETRSITGQTPADLKAESVWSEMHLVNMQHSIMRLIGLEAGIKGIPNPDNDKLMEILAPRCNIFASLEDKFASFRKRTSY